MHSARPLVRLAKAALFAALAGAFTGTAAAQDEQQPCAFDTIIDLRIGTPITPLQLFDEASNTQLVFLGERHGTPEHVELASCILEAKTGSRPPVLALEHVPASVQAQIDDWRRDNAFDTDLFADIVNWERLGWPDFNIYRPLIETAGSARAHIIATDRPLPGAGGPSFSALLAVAPDYGLQTEEIVEAWVPDMIAGHCGLIDEEAAATMALAQMQRDQIMAGRLIAGRGRGPSTLFFGGKGHVRMDRAIPYLIARTDRPPSMLTVAAYTVEEWESLLEAGPVREQGLNALYDVVVVAGNASPTDEELCEDMRAAMGG